MTSTAVREITFSCGHTEERDLSDRPAAKRAGFARWLAEEGTCSACFKKSRATDREEFFKQQREARDAWETTGQWPELDGRNDKATNWGRDTRFKLVNAAWESLGLDEAAFDEAVGAPAHAITDASWWIDQRDEDAEDLPEIVQSYEPAEDDAPNENPY